MNENQDKQNMSYDDYKVEAKENKGKKRINKGLIKIGRASCRERV